VHDTRRTRLVLGVLLLAAIILITFDYRDSSSGPVRGLQHGGGSVFGEAERAVSTVTNPVVAFINRDSGGGSSGQVAALQQQVIRLRAELNAEQLSKAEYKQLSQLLQLSGRGGYRIVAANVIAVAQGYSQTVTLDAGTSDGVKAGDTVLNGDGLVGTITSVTAQTGTVQLATDANSVVGVTLAPSGQFGWVTGPGKTTSGSGLLKLQVLDANIVLTPGEALVTYASTDNRPYVAGVPVGVISKVEPRGGSLTALALVRPYVDFTSLSVVGIVVAPPAQNPRFSVLPPPPPAPKPVPTVTVTVPARPSASTSPGG
jgi:rod shape-determining protein MreC